MRRLLPCLVLTVALGAACRGPEVPSPLVGQTRYLCCNLRYEKPTITDVNWQVGALIPVGTRVTITKVYRDVVVFQPVGHEEITFEHKYGKRTQSMEQFLEQWFPETDPGARLRKVATKTRKNIEVGAVEPGMTRQQVLMSIGYPPAHETPSLESSQWTYWRNRWARFLVFFDGDKVVRVQG